MTDTNKLAELIKKAKTKMCGKTFHSELERNMFVADYLLANDVVKVVRCKDCKYQDDCAGQIVHTTRDYVLEQNISTYNKVDFCSYGELKELG